MIAEQKPDACTCEADLLNLIEEHKKDKSFSFIMIKIEDHGSSEKYKSRLFGHSLNEHMLSHMREKLHEFRDELEE